MSERLIILYFFDSGILGDTIIIIVVCNDLICPYGALILITGGYELYIFRRYPFQVYCSKYAVKGIVCAAFSY